MWERNRKAKTCSKKIELVRHLLVRNKLHFVISNKMDFSQRSSQRDFISTDLYIVRLPGRSQALWHALELLIGERWSFHSIIWTHTGEEMSIYTPIFREMTSMSVLYLGWGHARCYRGHRSNLLSWIRRDPQRWWCWSPEGWVSLRQLLTGVSVESQSWSENHATLCVTLGDFSKRNKGVEGWLHFLKI